jgi:DNA-binding response OmpR family regulator
MIKRRRLCTGVEYSFDMSKKILIVDDDPGMRDAFRLILDRAGYDPEVLAAADAILEGRQPAPELYILDKQLSGVDGLDVCRFLKRQDSTQHIPVIIVSATPHVARSAEAACADAFIEKPFRKQVLLDAVSRCLEHAGSPAQPLA